VHWRIGIRLNHTPLCDAASGGGLEGFRWIESRKGHFWADPFAIEYAGKKWAFFEDYEYATHRGRIECAEISGEGNLISPTACLESPNHHYSYPYVFQDGPALYMIPEAFDSGAIDLFRCIEFPKQIRRYFGMAARWPVVDDNHQRRPGRAVLMSITLLCGSPPL